ncbi:MAG: polysaccharide biosynthesis/export family protein [Bacteroidota bacterium]
MKKRHHTTWWLLPAAAFLLNACAAYKQNIMFRVPEGEQLAQVASQAERNYVVQKNDQLQIDIYTNRGERIIDPDLKLAETIPNQAAQTRPVVTYQVDINGNVKLPMVGDVHAEGLTLRQLEEELEKRFATYYANPLAVVRYLNKRVIVLGAPGGQVIPLTNENVELAEVLALAKGIDVNGKASNIRVVRDDQVFLVDFSTIEGYRKGNMIMEPGDIVYVEPIRKPVSEAVRDYGPLVSILASIVTLIVVINNSNN